MVTAGGGTDTRDVERRALSRFIFLKSPVETLQTSRPCPLLADRSGLGSHGCSALMLASTAPLPRHCSALGRKVYWHGDVIRANGHCNSSLVAKSAIITQFLCRVGECPSSLGFKTRPRSWLGHDWPTGDMTCRQLMKKKRERAQSVSHRDLPGVFLPPHHGEAVHPFRAGRGS